MTKFKRLMALAAVSMLGIQLMGVVPASAAAIDGECDFGSDNLEITLGTLNGSRTGSNSESGDVEIWIDGTDLYCKDFDGADVYQALSSIESLTVEMDDDESNGSLFVFLDDANESGVAAEWPEFDTFDLNVTSKVFIDGDAVNDESANRLRITVGAKSVSFSGTTATSVAPSYEITGGDGGDTIDGSKATARIYADGGKGTDTIKGGSGKDDLEGGQGVDVLYGNAGNDTLDCGGDGEETRFEQGWGGDGDDSITDCNIVAPGAGNDDVYNGATYAPADPLVDAGNDLFALSYADLTKGIEWDSSELLTGGAAGEDVIDQAPYRFYGSAGDDVIYDEDASRVYAGGGDDLVKTGAGATVFAGAGNDLVADASLGNTNDTFYGQAGNDVLRGKMGSDDLFGGAGNDQTWGGPGADTCGGEVTNRCEYFKGRN